MNLKAQLLEDMKQAMKSKDTVKLSVIRFLRSEIKNFEIDHGEQDDKGVEKIISSQVKKIKDAINEFANANRDDLVTQEKAKLVILESYLPEQLSDVELEAIVDQVMNLTTEKNMGKLIGLVVREVNGRADGGRVSALVKAKLG